MRAVETSAPVAGLTTELCDVVQVRVENHHPPVDDPVGHHHATVGEERDILWTTKVGLIVSGHVLLAQRRQQLAPVVGEDEDLMPRLVDHPHPLFRVIRTDPNAVRTGALRPFEQVVPLVPHLDQVAIPIDDVNAVLPRAPIRIGERIDPDGAHKPGEPRRHRIGQPGLATLHDENAVGRLGVNT